MRGSGREKSRLFLNAQLDLCYRLLGKLRAGSHTPLSSALYRVESKDKGPWSE